ncbi:MAG TPA: 4'-phosphopantetheinyl transferase superfamily protein [Thermoanaerobaculia bacterium]|nr:4'-phosphopantetheinyl transferase superfamily protein [Thermoanaerobaculia bacterium]
MKSLDLPSHWRDLALVIIEADLAAAEETHFSAGEIDIARGFPLPRRRDEWMISRIAVKELAVARGLVSTPRSCSVETESSGRPRLIVAGDAILSPVSLSHTTRSRPRGVVESGTSVGAAAIDESAIGIDVQFIRPLDERGLHLFLSDEEVSALQRCTTPLRALHLWCAKEAAWKRLGGTITTLKRVALTLEAMDASSARFRGTDGAIVETACVTNELIVALATGE